MNLNLDGLRVIVTAGAGGIGKAIVELFLQEGARVFVCDIDPMSLDRLVAEFPAVGICQCDVSDDASVARMFEDAIRFLGGLDCLVNNAGSVGPTKPTAEISAKEWERCVQINLSSAFLCTNQALPHLCHSSNASIVSISSAAGRLGYPNKAPYAAAKWGIIGFMKTVSIEYGPQGIRCNCVLPGPVDNATMEEMVAKKAELAGTSHFEQKQKYLALASLKSFAKADEVADLVVFLSSQRARSISGQAIGIDGDLQALV